MKQLFILTYKGNTLLEGPCNFDSLTDTRVHIIDNGQQEWSKYKDNVIHTTKTNLGCAGGWNLICEIAFKKMNLEYAIISNDDNIITNDMLTWLDSEVSPSTIIGVYDKKYSVEFSLFAIHRDTYETIGRFDENFKWVQCEDGDYKHRAKLNRVTVNTGDWPRSPYHSFSSYDIPNYRNADYIEKKWGRPEQYLYPFNDKTISTIPKEVDIETMYSVFYGPLGDKWPSEFEYERFIRE
jgi:hypothetical protein